MNDGILMVISYFHARIVTLGEKREEGASAVEYGLLVSLIAGVIITIVTTLGGKISTAFTNVSGAIK